MTCRELAEFLDDYYAGELPAEARRAFDEHLAVCPDCVNYLASYRATIAMGKQAFGPDADVPPDSVPPELIDAILSARPTRK